MRTAARPLGVIGLVLGIVLAALLSTYWLGGGAVGTAKGDPDSANPDGSRAITTILRERGGVQVRTVRTANELGNTDGGTLVIATSQALSEATIARLREAIDSAAGVVLIRPHVETLTALTPQILEEDRSVGVLRAQCLLADLDPALEISGASRLYRLRAGSPGGVCFSQLGGGAALPGALAWTSSAGRRTVVVGNLDMFTNAGLADVDNAAVALRLLGREGQLTWYTGGSGDAAPAAATPGRPWPPAWLGPLTLGLTGVVLALMAWRGRRLGRLATEPLPVVVQANETTLARGRLYRRGKDPAHAARVLQDAVRRRLSAALALPPAADLTLLVQSAARASGRPPQEIHDLLTRTPAGAADLAALAQELARLDREVRRA